MVLRRNSCSRENICRTSPKPLRNEKLKNPLLLVGSDCQQSGHRNGTVWGVLTVILKPL